MSEEDRVSKEAMAVTVKEATDDGLEQRIWGFAYAHEENKLFLETSLIEVRPSKRHRFKMQDVYVAGDRKNSTIPLSETKCTVAVLKHARNLFIAAFANALLVSKKL